MEKMQRLFLGSRSAMGGGGGGGGMMPPSANNTSDPSPRSVFHVNNVNNNNNSSCWAGVGVEEEGVGQEMRDCYQGMEEFGSAMRNMDGAGTHLTESLARVLRGTRYQRVGETLCGGFRQVYGSPGSLRLLDQLKEMEALLLGGEASSPPPPPPQPSSSSCGDEELRLMYAQTSCHVLLLFAKLQKQYFAACHQKMADLVHHLLAARDPERSGEVTKFILKLGLDEEAGLREHKAIASLPNTPWGSPKLRSKTAHGSPKSQQCHDGGSPKPASHGSPKPSSHGSPKPAHKSASSPSSSSSHGSPKSPHSRGFKLFSLFERKPSPEEGRSAFYVSVPEEGGEEEERGVGGGEGEVVDAVLMEEVGGAPPQPKTAGSLVGVGGGALLPSSSPVVASASASAVYPPEVSLLLGSVVPLVTRTDEMNNECAPDFTLEDSAGAHLASEEDLDSVINLLSGVGGGGGGGYGSPSSYPSPYPSSSPSPSPSPSHCYTAPLTPNSMLSIPEDPPPPPSTPGGSEPSPLGHSSVRSPMQLSVPGGHRMRSPVSDSQLDELQVPRLQAQVHRRSEGCLDLSSMARGGTSSWPHHHHHHQQHRASLPAVQLHAPYRHPFDPLPPCGDPSQDPLPLHHLPPSSAPSSYLPHHHHHDFSSLPPAGRGGAPPLGYLGSSSSGGGSAGSGNGSMSGSGLMSGLQWSSFGGGGGNGGGGGGGGGMEMRNSGTWPLYQPLSMPLGDSLNSSWSGAQDGSDGSDDSSNGDHFFAVGKDLVDAIDSRHESSDEEGEGGRNKIHKEFFDYERQVGCTNTWPMMQHLPASGLHFPPAAEYPDLLEPPPAPPAPHRPLQMQWSDPVATRNVWSAANQAAAMAGHKNGGVQGTQPTHSGHGYGRLN